MAPNVIRRVVHGHRVRRKPKTPKDRREDAPVRVTYFPGEAARILGLHQADYRQLRRLFAVISTVPPKELAAKAKKNWTWSRYEFQDLVALRAAMRLARAAPGARLDLKAITESCGVLRTVFKVARPFTEVQLERRGETIVARVGGRAFDARTGQQLIEWVADQVTEYVENSLSFTEQDACLDQLNTQRRELLTAANRATSGVAMATTRSGK